MSIEIERKFLIHDDSWKESAGEGILYRQGYLFLRHSGVLRVRIAGDRAVWGLKIGRSMRTRLEYEYEIPRSDAEEILSELCECPAVTKIRHIVEFGGMIWEVDEFLELNKGLVLAEIELEREDQEFDLPSWVGEEVSDSPKYLSFNLYRYPYSMWDCHEKKSDSQEM